MRYLNKWSAVVVVVMVATAITVFVSLAPAATAPEEVRGTIVSVNAQGMRFVLKTEESKNITFLSDEDAQVYINNEEASLSDLRVDDKVTVEGRADGELWYFVIVRCERVAAH